MVNAIDILTVIVSLTLFIRYHSRMVQKSRYIVYVVFFAFYVFPLILDILVMEPVYSFWRYHGFLISYNDPASRIIYDIGLIITQSIILFKKSKTKTQNKSDSNYNNLSFLLVVGMISPIIITLLISPVKSIVYMPMWRENELYISEAYNPISEKLSYIGVFCAITLFFEKRSDRLLNNLSYKLVCTLCLYMNICIQGKRSIFFFAIVITIIVLIPGLKDMKDTEDLQYEVFKKRRLHTLEALAVLAAALMIYITVYVKINNRGYAAEVSVLFTQTRIDFLRDDRVRMAIYSLLHPDEITILNYPGQSLLPIPTWIFPLDYFSNFLGLKTYSYQVYFSAALQGLTIDTSQPFMTTALLAELVSNFHLLGFILFGLLSVKMSEIADNLPYPGNALIITFFVSLQMYSMSYIGYFFEFVLLVYFIHKSKIRVVFHNHNSLS